MSNENRNLITTDGSFTVHPDAKESYQGSIACYYIVNKAYIILAITNDGIR